MSEDRVISFSIKPTDTKGMEDIRLLKEYSKEKGVSFSYLILEALDKKAEDLNLKEGSSK
jgi:hypothetical protein